MFTCFSDIYFEVLDSLSLIIWFCNCHNYKNNVALFPESSLPLCLMKQWHNFISRAVPLLCMQLLSAPQTFRRKKANDFKQKWCTYCSSKKNWIANIWISFYHFHQTAFLWLPYNNRALTAFAISGLKHLLKFEAISYYCTTRGGSRGDVGYGANALPHHQPFSTMFWMNRIFP